LVSRAARFLPPSARNAVLSTMPLCTAASAALPAPAALAAPAPSRPAAAVQGCPPRAAPRPAGPVATRPGARRRGGPRAAPRPAMPIWATRPGARRCGWPRTGPRSAVPNPTPNPAGGAQVRLAAQRQHALLEELQLALTQRAWLGPRPAASAAPAAAAGGRLAPQARPCCSAIAPDVRMCTCQAMLPRMLGSFAQACRQPTLRQAARSTVWPWPPACPVSGARRASLRHGRVRQSLAGQRALAWRAAP